MPSADVIKELEKPGRDPRPEFKTARFQEGVNTVADLKPGMQLEGVVTNVAAFGAFVDIGVHQDGLVHISALSNQFVKDLIMLFHKQRLSSGKIDLLHVFNMVYQLIPGIGFKSTGIV
jgi:transcriptional accessory protein Tex/SPT6